MKKVTEEEIARLRRLCERPYGGISGQQVYENTYLTTLNKLVENSKLLESIEESARDD